MNLFIYFFLLFKMIEVDCVEAKCLTDNNFEGIGLVCLTPQNEI